MYNRCHCPRQHWCCSHSKLGCRPTGHWEKVVHVIQTYVPWMPWIPRSFFFECEVWDDRGMKYERIVDLQYHMHIQNVMHHGSNSKEVHQFSWGLPCWLLQLVPWLVERKEGLVLCRELSLFWYFQVQPFLGSEIASGFHGFMWWVSYWAVFGRLPRTRSAAGSQEDGLPWDLAWKLACTCSPLDLFGWGIGVQSSWAIGASLLLCQGFDSVLIVFLVLKKTTLIGSCEHYLQNLSGDRGREWPAKV